MSDMHPDKLADLLLTGEEADRASIKIDTPEKLTALISRAVDKDGNPFTIHDVDTRGHKDSSQLLLEVKDSEVNLSLATCESRLRIIRSSMSGKLIIEDKGSGKRFREIGREFDDGGCVWNIKEHGISETRRRRETYKESVAWGLWEELRIFISLEELYETPEQRSGNMRSEADEYESSVYYGIRTRAIVFKFTWHPFSRSIPLLLRDLFRSKTARAFCQRLISLCTRFVFWLGFKFDQRTVIKERDGVKVYGQWFKKELVAHRDVIGEAAKATSATDELKELPELFNKLDPPPKN